jgi:hypothetical protein
VCAQLARLFKGVDIKRSRSNGLRHAARRIIFEHRFPVWSQRRLPASLEAPPALGIRREPWAA